MRIKCLLNGALVVSLLLVSEIWAQGYTLTNQQFLPGDTTPQTAVRIQANTRIAAGGPGYLVVWRDERTVISGFIGASTVPLQGNMKDIYAARLDGNGNLLDQSPIIISNAGVNQTQYDVAWNGQNWLVVWVTERSDWYFFQDIMAVRVSPQGVILDSVPIPIRLANQSPSGDQGSNPSVTSDGTNWVVTWQDLTYQGSLVYPNIVAARISPNGTIIDNPPIVLHTGETPGTFGPVNPQMRLAGDELLVVWEYSGLYTILGKRFNLNLQPIDLNPIPIASNLAYNSRLASNGTDFMVVTHDRLAYRITHNGTALDPNGIDFGFGGATDRGPDVTWDGSNWVVGFSTVNSFTWKMYLSRITTGGVVLPPGSTQVGFGADDQFNISLASQGGGFVVSSWDQRSATLLSAENVHSVRVDANWNLTADQDVSLGWHRQTYVRTATNGNQHMAVFMSQGGGQNRILAQRIDASGNPLDLEPAVLGTTSEGYTGISTSAPEVAFNGSVYLAVWTLNGTIYGRRIQANGTLVDPNPIGILTDNATSAAVAAVGDTFYVAYTYVYSGNQQSLKGVRVNAANLGLIGSPAVIGVSGYDLNPVVRSFANRWLVVWENQITHDNVVSTIRGRFIEANGTAGSAFAISTSGDADYPDVAIAGSRALIAWHEYTSQDGRVRARLMDQGGTFPGSQFLVNDANNRQWFATTAWDGGQFVVAWTDYRSNVGIVEQLRGDIYATRVSYDGIVADPDGIQITSGSLPEDLPAAAAFNGKTVIIYSRLNGAVNPEIQRVGYRILENTAGGNLNLTITPINPPIQIPLNGGSFQYNVNIHNTTISPIVFSLWNKLRDGSGNYYPMFGPINRSLPGGANPTRTLTQTVASSIPSGTLTFISYVGTYPNSITDSSYFNITKLAATDGNPWISESNVTGDLFDDYAVTNTVIPDEYSLRQNYPNPFNPTTTLSFSLPQAGKVMLTVYDVSGREVAKLVDGWREAGTHQVTFDATGLTSGIYLYRMTIGNFNAVGKMALLK
ncbi:MAG: T9SS type A sorting domain-containing protein [bacterium]|nr:T9SS type A sorting domain-containing protein [bacterium]